MSVNEQDIPETATLADVIRAINTERQEWRRQRDIHVRHAEESKAERARTGRVSAWD